MYIWFNFQDTLFKQWFCQGVLLMTEQYGFEIMVWHSWRDRRIAIEFIGILLAQGWSEWKLEFMVPVIA